MFDEDFLREKERIQKELFDNAGRDWNRYVKMTDELINKMEEQYHIKFKYVGKHTDSN